MPLWPGKFLPILGPLMSRAQSSWLLYEVRGCSESPLCLLLHSLVSSSERTPGTLLYSFPRAAVTEERGSRNVFCHSFEGQRFWNQGAGRATSLWRLRGRRPPGLCQLLVAPGVPWLVAASYNLCLFTWSAPSFLCFPVSSKDTHHWIQEPSYSKMVSSRDVYLNYISETLLPSSFLAFFASAFHSSSLTAGPWET